MIAGKAYHLSVDYKPKDYNIKDITLQWIEPDSRLTTEIPVKNLFFAAESKFKPISSSQTEDSAICKVYDLIDSSCNGIPDAWALQGYTVSSFENGEIMLESWDDDLHTEPTYTKYFSAMYKYSTADDPYSDYQKVTGIGLDKAVSLDARNPLVAAVPIIHANLEKFIISMNATITNDKSASKESNITVSSSKSSTDGYTNDLGGSVSGGWKGWFEGPEFNITATYNRQWNHSSTVNKENSNSSGISSGWSKSLQMNEADAAYFLPIVRYENVGTAPAYELAPTFNFMASKSKILLSTVTAKSNALAQGLAPDEFYPVKGTPGILMTGSDDFNSQPIKLNKQQLDSIENDGFINTYVTQISAKLKYFNEAGRPLKDSEFEDNWNTYLTQSRKTTAKIDIFLPDGSMKSRMIAAQNPNDASENRSKPEVTLGQALELIGLRHDNNINRWQAADSNKKVNYEFENLSYVFDKKTLDEINTQLAIMSNNKDLTKIKLYSDMQLSVCPEGKVLNKITQKYSLWRKCKVVNSNINLNAGDTYISYDFGSVKNELPSTVAFVVNKTLSSANKVNGEEELIFKSNSGMIPNQSSNIYIFCNNSDKGFNINASRINIDDSKNTKEMHNASLNTENNHYSVLKLKAYEDVPCDADFVINAKGWQDKSINYEINVHVNKSSRSLNTKLKLIGAVNLHKSNGKSYYFLNDGNYIRYDNTKDKIDFIQQTSSSWKGITDEQAKMITAVSNWNNSYRIKKGDSENSIYEKTHFFLSNGQYLRYDNIIDKVDLISLTSDIWPGITNDQAKMITGVINWGLALKGKTYFFLNNGQYIRYNNILKKAEGVYSISENWSGITEKQAKMITAVVDFNGDAEIKDINSQDFMDGKSYFFLSNGEYLKYNNLTNKVENVHQDCGAPNNFCFNVEKS